VWVEGCEEDCEGVVVACVAVEPDGDWFDHVYVYFVFWGWRWSYDVLLWSGFECDCVGVVVVLSA
jgi:hypothetical protein